MANGWSWVGPPLDADSRCCEVLQGILNCLTRSSPFLPVLPPSLWQMLLGAACCLPTLSWACVRARGEAGATQDSASCVFPIPRCLL